MAQQSYLGRSSTYISRETVSQLNSGQGASQSDNRIVYGGLTDMEGARAVARRLFDTYDRDRYSNYQCNTIKLHRDGNIDNIEVVPMIVDTYRAFNRQYNPNKSDIESYIRVLDYNKDGKLNYADIEEACIRYLVGNSQ